MPKVHPKDKLLYALDAARRAWITKRPILEQLTDNKDIGEVIQTNLDRSYKQRHNIFLAQLHWVGTSIKHYRDKNVPNGEIRRLLGITRKQYYSALAIAKAIREPDAIPYLEDIAPKDFDLSEKDLDYVRWGAWPEIVDPHKEELAEKAKDDKMRQLIKELFDP